MPSKPTKKPAAKKPASRSPKRRSTASTSKHFENARSRARKILEDPEATKKLADAAEQKARGKKKGKISEVLDHLKAMLRLIRAYAKGDYRAISWESLVLIVAAISYFVSPVDAIPDFLPGGYVDDAGVIAFVLLIVNEEVDDFIAWERRMNPHPDEG